MYQICVTHLLPNLRGERRLPEGHGLSTLLVKSIFQLRALRIAHSEHQVSCVEECPLIGSGIGPWLLVVFGGWGTNLQEAEPRGGNL